MRPQPVSCGLEGVAAATPEAAAGEAASTPSAKGRATRTARGGGHGGAGHGGHGTEVVGEGVWVEAGAKTATLVPLGGLRVDALEGAAPIFFDTQSHGERKELFEHFGRFDHAIEAVGLDVGEKILEAEDAFESAGTGLRTRGHNQAEAADDKAGDNPGDDEGHGGHAEMLGEPMAETYEDGSCDEAKCEVGGAYAVRATSVIRIADERSKDLVPHDGDVRVESVVKLVEGDEIAGIARTEKAVEKGLFMGLERGPLGAGFLEVEDVVLTVSEAEEMIFLFFLDDDVATDGQVNDGGSDIAHVHGVVDQGTHFAGRELVGRFILCSDGAQARVAAACPPPPEHKYEDENGKDKRPIAAEIEEEEGEGGGLADGALIECGGEREAFVNVERSGGLHVDAGAFDSGAGGGTGGTKGAGEGLGAEVSSAFGEDDVGACGIDLDGPFVASDVPVELVVVVEVFEGVGDGVVDGDGSGGIVSAGDVNLDSEIVADAAGFVSEVLAGIVGNALDAEEEGIVESARAGIFDGDVAIDAVPGTANELEGNVFGDVNRAVGEDGNVGEEFSEVALLGSGGRNERGEDEEEKSQGAHEADMRGKGICRRGREGEQWGRKAHSQKWPWDMLRSPQKAAATRILTWLHGSLGRRIKPWECRS